MTPQLLQSIQIMTLPLADLRLRIQEELETNPALELIHDKATVSLDGQSEREALSEAYEPFENSSDPGFTDGGRFQGDENSKRMYMEGAFARPESLHDHLLWQLHLQPIPPEAIELGDLVINNLDENGFHREDPLTLVDGERHAAISEIITRVQQFDPIGCATRDFRESLIVQLSQFGDLPPGIESIITDHLESLERGKYREIAREIGVSVDDVVESLEVIRHLDPFPGRRFATDEMRYVVPDLILRRRDGEFVLVLNDEEIPVLGVNSTYSRIADAERAPSSDRDARQFATAGVREARWFINSIKQRNQTLLKVAHAILEYQRDFFLKGKKYLVPLTLRDIAQEVNVSEATVSRVTNGKYLQTEWGIFELKHFFSNSIGGTGSGGSRYSKGGVKETVREILENHQDGKPLSDQRISELLAQRGIKIARRTVAKYRKELRISSSYER